MLLTFMGFFCIPLVSASRPMVALAALIAALPVAVVFLVSQRALARGLVGDTAGS